jgi:group I intron endonuclease
MKQYYIYLTTNLIDGKQYIGQHHGEIDDSYIGSGSLLKKAVSKYGKENFKKEILEICQDYESMNIAERKWIQAYDAVANENFYNIAEGGFNSNPCAGMSEEAQAERKRKLSEAAKGEKNYFYGKHFCKEEHPWWGRHHNEESKKKMSEAKQGGKAPTAKGVAIYDLNGNFIREFETQRDFKVFVGLSPNGSTDTLKKYILQGKPYHGYIVKYI